MARKYILSPKWRPSTKFSTQHGIVHEVTALYTPQYNGFVERKNRTLKEIMNAILINSGLPSNIWSEAILSSKYLLNRVPHKKQDKTLYELWSSK